MKPQARHSQGQGAARWRIGVDGGGTNTRLRLCDAAGKPLAEGRAGPSALGQGAAPAWAALGAALADAAAAAGLPTPPWPECALGLGLSGAGSAQWVAGFLALDPGCAQIRLDSDGFAALLGAHAGRPGALLIAGTGSVAEAWLADGSRRQVGGWGWKNGDEGSGAWLGLAALRELQRVLDGRAAAGPLSQAVLAQVRSQQTGEPVPALLAWNAAAGQQQVASLAPLVFAHEADDAVAARLLAQAVAELEQLAQAVHPSLPLVLAGSVAERLAPRFSAATRARLVHPAGDAAQGALYLLPEPA